MIGLVIIPVWLEALQAIAGIVTTVGASVLVTGFIIIKVWPRFRDWIDTGERAAALVNAADPLVELAKEQKIIAEIVKRELQPNGGSSLHDAIVHQLIPHLKMSADKWAALEAADERLAKELKSLGVDMRMIARCPAATDGECPVVNRKGEAPA